MKSKLTIVLAVLLLAILAMPHTADAQNGYTVSRQRGLDKVVASGNNQLVPAVILATESTADDAQITRRVDGDLTITVQFGDRPIIQATAWTATGVDDDSPESIPMATDGEFPATDVTHSHKRY